MTVRAAQSGDICILLVPSRPSSTKVEALLDGLKADFGGRIVTPLHVTVDRVPPADREVVVSAVRECVPRLRRASIRANDLFVLRSAYRGADVLKLDVARDDTLDSDIDEIRGALRAAGLRPTYGEERSMTVTVLERIERSSALDPAAWGLPIELFAGDTLLVSRIRGVGSYEILHTASITTSG